MGNTEISCARARARVGALCASPLGGHGKPHLKLEIQSVTAKGSLQCPGQHGDNSIVGNTEITSRARASARCAQHQSAVTYKPH
eukprot:7882961-Pyramimonas_sp.AAC.1